MKTILLCGSGALYLLVAVAVHRAVYMAFQIAMGEPPEKWRIVKVGLFWPWYLTTWALQSAIGRTFVDRELFRVCNRRRKRAEELSEVAWGLISNAGNPLGDWSTCDPLWVEAAERWRDDYFSILPPTRLLTRIDAAAEGNPQ